MNLLHIFLLVEGILLVCFGISYVMYIHYRDVVFVNFPVDFKSPEYVNNLKREIFWKFMTANITMIMFLFFVTVVTVVYGGVIIYWLGSVL